MNRTPHLPSPNSTLRNLALVLAYCWLPGWLVAQATVAAEPARVQERASTQTRILKLFEEKCQQCHYPNDAQGGVLITNHSNLITETAVVRPGNWAASELYRRVTATDASRMPPPGEPPLTDADKALIRQWIEEGAKPFPGDLSPRPKSLPVSPPAGRSIPQGDEYVLASIARHIESTNEETRPFLRYFSINHLSGSNEDTLQAHRDALTSAVNHLSWSKELVVPTPVDAPVNTVFAVDIRITGWSAQAVAAGSRAANLYDLVLLEYPYALWREDSPSLERLVPLYLSSANLIRPITYVRADWFVASATQSPLYEELLQLPRTVVELEKLLNVDRKQNLSRGEVVRAGLAVSGVSRNARIVERHPQSDGYYWVSFDFSSNTGEQNFFRDPLNPKSAGGEMIFSLPNGLQGYFIADGRGQRLEAAPTSIVADHFASDAVVRNGLSCIRCHQLGIKRFRGTVQEVVDRLPGSAGVDKRRIRQLYPGSSTTSPLVERDREHFDAARRRMLGDSPATNAFGLVVKQFQDEPLTIEAAAAELGLVDAEGLKFAFRTRRLLGLGMAPLAGGSVIRRDSWEEAFSSVAKELGIGVPLPQIDGLAGTKPLPPNQESQVRLSTNRTNNVFARGDSLVVTITNDSKEDVFVELVGTSEAGEKVVLVKGNTRLAAGGTLRFPGSGGIFMGDSPARERISLFAANSKFAPGEVLKGEGVRDRLVHALFDAASLLERRSVVPPIIKRELVIETR